MAPVVLKTRNLKVIVYPNDHEPPHVHIIGPGVEAKFEIQTLDCISNYGFSSRDLRRIEDFLSDWKELLMEAWDDYQE